MARPPKNGDDRRDCIMHYRCTPEERGHIAANAKAAGMSLSDYQRRMNLYGYVVPLQPVNVALDEVQRNGNNLNQLTRVANIDHEIRGVARAIEEMKAVYRDAWDALIEILSGKVRQ